MGLSSTFIYTSELILCSTICVPSATRHNIHMLENSPLICLPTDGIFKPDMVQQLTYSFLSVLVVCYG